VRRVHLFGASGSGTTTLGAALAVRLGVPHLDTDSYFWLPTDPPFSEMRDLGERQAMLRADVAMDKGWVLSGSLCGWGDPVITRFELAVFVWVPPEERMARLRAREWQRHGHAPDPEFLAWAERYDSAGLEQRSRRTHEAWMTQLYCPLLRLDQEVTVDDNVAAVLEALDQL